MLFSFFFCCLNVSWAGQRSWGLVVGLEVCLHRSGPCTFPRIDVYLRETCHARYCSYTCTLCFEVLITMQSSPLLFVPRDPDDDPRGFTCRTGSEANNLLRYEGNLAPPAPAGRRGLGPSWPVNINVSNLHQLFCCPLICLAVCPRGQSRPMGHGRHKCGAGQLAAVAEETRYR